MEEKLKVLVKLQDCDSRIKSIQKKTDEAPRKIQELKRELEAAETGHQDILSRLGSQGQKRRELERDIEELDNRMAKSNKKLDNIKSNKEFKAVLKEIEDLNREKSRLEDNLIELMEEFDMLEKKSEESERQKKIREESFANSQEQILGEVEILRKDLESLMARRALICSDIDNDLLKRYNFLKEKKQDIALSPVIKGICQTCHMNIPQQKFNELVRGDKIMTCPHCNRIIYWGENERLKEPFEE